MLPVELGRRSGWRMVGCAAAMRHPSWAVAGLGLVVEPEEEAGAGLWLTPGLVKMAYRCRRPLMR